MRHTVLVVAKESGPRAALRDILLGLDVAVTTTSTADEGLAVVQNGGVSVAVVGLGEPDQPTLQAVAEFRRLAPDLHLIVLSASGGHDARMRCFAAGADDVVADPFELSELAARVNAGVRHPHSLRQAVLTFDHLELDLNIREVRVDHRTVPLTRLEFNLFRFMALHPGRTYSRDQLLAAVWGSSALMQRQTTVTEHVRRLRKKLDVAPANSSWISTVQGRGYHFNEHPGPAPVDLRQEERC